MEWPPVIDSNDHFLARGDVAHPHIAGNGQGAVRSGQAIQAEEFTASGAPPVEFLAIPGRQATLLPGQVGGHRRVALPHDRIGLVRPALPNGLDPRLGIGRIGQISRGHRGRAIARPTRRPARRRARAGGAPRQDQQGRQQAGRQPEGWAKGENRHGPHHTRLAPRQAQHTGLARQMHQRGFHQARNRAQARHNSRTEL